jgi:hypothetical protein
MRLVERDQPLVNPRQARSAGGRVDAGHSWDSRLERPTQSTFPLRVLQTDNEPRVRDGYISLGTRGHARARETSRGGAIYRRNVIARALPCPPVPPLNLHGKEGVDGSSPSEGFAKGQQMALFCARASADRRRTLPPTYPQDRSPAVSPPGSISAPGSSTSSSRGTSASRPPRRTEAASRSSRTSAASSSARSSR